MLLKKVKYEKDPRPFEKVLEDMSNYNDYKKKLKQSLRLLFSSKKRFCFFHKFKFGSVREACFVFGDLDDSPWDEIIDGGKLYMPAIKEPEVATQWEFLLERMSLTMKKDDKGYYIYSGKGWEDEYKSSQGECWKVRKRYEPGYHIFVRVREDRGVFKKYRPKLEELLEEACDDEYTLVVLNLQTWKDLYEEIKMAEDAWRKSPNVRNASLLDSLLEEWAEIIKKSKPDSEAEAEMSGLLAQLAANPPV